MPALAGVGMLKAVLAVALAAGFLDRQSETFQVLNFVSDTAFYFLPFLLADSSAKKFGCNPHLALSLAGVLLHPTFTRLLNIARDSGGDLHLFGLPIPYANYGSSVVSIILTIRLASMVEPFVNRFTPKIVKFLQYHYSHY